MSSDTASANRDQLVRDVDRLMKQIDNMSTQLQGHADVGAELKSANEEVETSNEGLITARSAKTIYEKMRDKSTAKNKCHFCKRDFQDDSQVQQMLTSVKSYVDKLPEHIVAAQKSVEEAKQKSSLLEKLRPLFEQCQHTRAEVQRLEGTLSLTRTEADSSVQQVISTRNLVLATEDRLQKLQSLRADAARFQSASQELVQTENLIRTKEAAAGSNISNMPSLADARAENSKLQEEVTKISKDEDLLRQQKDSLTSQVVEMKQKAMDRQSKAQVLEQQAKRSAEASVELNEQQRLLNQAEGKSTTSKQNLMNAQTSLEQLRTNRDSATATANADITTLEKSCNDLKSDAVALREASTRLIEFEQKMKTQSARSQQLSNELKQAEQEVVTMAAAVKNAREQHDKARDASHENEVLAASLQRNIDYYERMTEAEGYESQLSELRQQLGAANANQLQQQISNKRNSVMAADREIAFISGELKTKQEALAAVQKDISSTIYHDIDKRFRDSIIAHSGAQLAEKDLKKYHSALDKALMKYHSMKMAEVNKIVKELWQQIYRGSDIDYIALRSDADNDANLPTGRGMASYNYRVVMVCGSAELEMRGRCSAGQKVLASLIIRLALSESFCATCGILALDEPTTNLDRHNVDGLARAMAELIEARRGHKNFQLVVITHDEQFVAALGRLQVCDTFYRVAKNDRGKSTINRHNIHLLG